jgi:hypothetical protein
MFITKQGNGGLVYFNMLVYSIFSFVSIITYFKNFWNKDVEGQDIMVYLIMHILMCLIFIKVFGV